MILSSIFKYFILIIEASTITENSLINLQNKYILTIAKQTIIMMPASNLITKLDNKPASIMKIQAIISLNSNSFSRFVINGVILTCSMRKKIKIKITTVALYSTWLKPFQYPTINTMANFLIKNNTSLYKIFKKRVILFFYQ